MKSSFAAVEFDYNQTPHNMGNGGRTMYHQASTGIWEMDQTLRKALGAAVDATPTASRNVLFHDALLGPTFETTSSINIAAMRKRGTIDVDLSAKLPFDLGLTYTREVKTGHRGIAGEDDLGNVSPVVALPEPLNDITQDFGLRAAFNKATIVYAKLSYRFQPDLSS